MVILRVRHESLLQVREQRYLGHWKFSPTKIDPRRIHRLVRFAREERERKKILRRFESSKCYLTTRCQLNNSNTKIDFGICITHNCFDSTCNERKNKVEEMNNTRRNIIGLFNSSIRDANVNL